MAPVIMEARFLLSFPSQFEGPDSGHQSSFMKDCPECMEAHYIEAGSMSIFWTQNRALKTTSLARVTTRSLWDLVGPSSSLR